MTLLVAAVSLSGCTTTMEVDSIRQFIELPDGEHFAWHWSTNASSNALAVTIIRDQGPDIDVYVLSPEAYEVYRNGTEPSNYVDSCTHFGVPEISFSCSVEAGSWVLVLDNSALGASKPTVFNKDYQAEVKIKATYEASTW